MAKETAEQKLLRLIEQGGGAEGASGQPASSSQPSFEAQQTLNAVQSVGGAFVLPGFLPQILSSCKMMFRSFSQGGFGIREVNKILFVAVLVMAAIFSMGMIRGLQTAQQIVDFKQPQPVKVPAENLLPQFADIQRYISAVSLRNIFNPFEKKEVAAQAVESKPVAAAARVFERTKALKLVGVSWLDTPDSASAMVENSTNGVTYFLRVGEKLNDVTVKSIYADGIVLEFEGERMELKL
jgi:hypothetical protein